MKIKNSFLFVLLLIACSCHVSLNASKNDVAQSKLQQIQKDVDKLYSVPSYYTDVSDQYVKIEAEVSDLKAYNSIRVKGNSAVEQTALLQKMILKFDSEHKSYGHISYPMASIYDQQLTEVINNILSYEKILK